MNESRIAEAVHVLRRGGLVAFPTETVYGLGADARNPAAVARLFAVKGRPRTHPLIVHLAAASGLDEWAAAVPTAARQLAQAFWPGPLTLILQRASHVSDDLTGGQETVGVRVPGHPLALLLLEAFGGGVAAPSANRFGRVSPTSAEHVRQDLGSDVDLILDGGPCEVGIESTIVDLSRGTPVLLRPGRVTVPALEEVLGEPVQQADRAAPRAPGMLATHYAPRTPLELVEPGGLPQRLQRGGDEPVLVLGFGGLPPAELSVVRYVAAPPTPDAYAQQLYATLRELDRMGASRILVEAPPDGPEWEGVADRLRRAANAAPPPFFPDRRNL